MATKAKDRSETKPLGSFAATVQRLILTLIRAYERCDRLCTREHAVTVSQGYTLLALPEDSSVTMNQLSEVKELASSTMTRVVDSLVGKGLVKRKPDPDDRRVVRVRLTDKGKEVRHILEKEQQELLEAALGEATDEERETIVSALDKLVTAINMVLAKYEKDSA